MKSPGRGALVALSLCFAYAAYGETISVQASAAVGQTINADVGVALEVSGASQAVVGMDFAITGCTPFAFSCPAFSIEVDLIGQNVGQQSAVLLVSTNSQGGDILPFAVCAGVPESQASVPPSCTMTLTPGLYAFSARVSAGSTSPGSIANASSVTGTLTVPESGGVVVVIPEPGTAGMIVCGALAAIALCFRRALRLNARHHRAARAC